MVRRDANRMDFLDSIEDNIRRIEQQMFRIEMMEDDFRFMGGPPRREREQPAEPERVNLARFMTQIQQIEEGDHHHQHSQANFVSDLTR